MAIPDYQKLMLPLLKFAHDRQEHSLRAAIDTIAADLGLSEAERKELLPSGQQAVFDNRVGWARTYLKKAGLLRSERRGYFQITDAGLELLKSRPETITAKSLYDYPEYREFVGKSNKPDGDSSAAANENSTPEEILEDSYQILRHNLAQELLQKVKESSPVFFEKLVVELLVKMGYGGSRKDAGEAIGKSGDEGIDGIIKEDRLGLDTIYIQAKRWENVVSRPEIQKFAGALQGQRARKGIFITNG